MTVARTRTRPVAPAVQVAPPPSNVVVLRPNFVPPNVSAEPANLQVAATTKRGKKASSDRGLQQPVSAFQEITKADLSPPANANASTLSKAEFRKLISGMTKMELRKRFQLEANSHRDIVSRCKGTRYTLHPDFRDFARFLYHMGPRPAPNWTVDRFDAANPEYGPGLCRWASPRTQANNRGVTVHLTAEGETRPQAEWARSKGVKLKTIAKRISRGWTDAEAVRGQRGPAAPAVVWREPVPVSLDEWPEGVTVDLWERGFEAFRNGAGKKYGAALRRAVFFCWIAGNGIAELKARLAEAHPNFGDDPDCEQPRLYGDATFDHYFKLCALHWALHWPVWEDQTSRGLYQMLQARHPGVRDIVNANAIVQRAEEPVDRW